MSLFSYYQHVNMKSKCSCFSLFIIYFLFSVVFTSLFISISNRGFLNIVHGLFSLSWASQISNKVVDHSICLNDRSGEFFKILRDFSSPSVQVRDPWMTKLDINRHSYCVSTRAIVFFPTCMFCSVAPNSKITTETVKFKKVWLLDYGK